MNGFFATVEVRLELVVVSFPISGCCQFGLKLCNLPLRKWFSPLANANGTQSDGLFVVVRAASVWCLIHSELMAWLLHVCVRMLLYSCVCCSLAPQTCDK